MITFCPLASGSKGNCIYLSTKYSKILIDAGLSLKTIKAKLAEIHVDIAEIDAILVSHEHTDHILAIKTIASQYSIPIFANSETAKGILEYTGHPPRFKIFTTGDLFEFQDLEIHPFSIQHDTLDPVAFTIQAMDKKIGICTDLGIVTTLVEHHLKKCDILYLEANHEVDMVHASSRPAIYKQRVLGRSGHLSNQESGKLLAKVVGDHLKTVYLAHLSSECNTKEKALSVVKSHLINTPYQFDIHIAEQHCISKQSVLYS
jgi:phosphoribosyl 1,2-cyclic phosphodiesterase